MTSVLTPVNEDLALGTKDRIHGYGATVYISFHYLAYIWIFGVDLFSNPWGLAFVLCANLCALCQVLRVDENRLATRVWEEGVRGWKRFGGEGKVAGGFGFQRFVYGIELMFMASENALFLVFLFGMLKGRATEVGW